MVPLNKLDSKSIMSREVLDEVFNQEDEIYRAELLASLALRASELSAKRYKKARTGRHPEAIKRS